MVFPLGLLGVSKTCKASENAMTSPKRTKWCDGVSVTSPAFLSLNFLIPTPTILLPIPIKTTMNDDAEPHSYNAESKFKKEDYANYEL